METWQVALGIVAVLFLIGNHHAPIGGQAVRPTMAMNQSGPLQVQSAPPRGRKLHGLLAATFLLVSCSQTSVPQPTTPTASATASDPTDRATAPAPTIPSPAIHRATPTPDQSQQAIDADIIGVLGGNPSLSSGCTWLIDEAGQRWEVLWPDGYQDSFRGDLTVLAGPDGATIASTGDRLGVNGAGLQMWAASA